MTPRRPPMKVRTVKVPDELWADAMKAAEDRDLYLSEEIRKWLEMFVKGEL